MNSKYKTSQLKPNKVWLAIHYRFTCADSSFKGKIKKSLNIALVILDIAIGRDFR